MISRRLFLRNTAVAGVAGTVAAAPAGAAPTLTPEERIDAALEAIKEAMMEKYPAGNCRVCRIGVASENDTVMVISNLSFLKPGTVEYMRDGKVVRREGGAT